MAEYFELEDKEKQANYKRLTAIKEHYKQIELEFIEESIISETNKLINLKP